MDAIELAARYSLMPNRLKYCGPEGADEVFFDFIATKQGKDEVISLLNKFKAVKLYLDLIAKNNSKNPLDKEVIEAYWIGNELLDNVPSSSIKNMILTDFIKEGLPRSVAEELAARTPEGITPHHSFHVLHVNFLTKKVEPNIINLDKCRISWGTVKKVDEDKKTLIVEYTPVVSRQNKTYLGKPAKKEIYYHAEFLDNLKEGDVVSVHWDMAVEKLDQKRLANLEKYTLKNIEVMNDSIPAV